MIVAIIVGFVFAFFIVGLMIEAKNAKTVDDNWHKEACDFREKKEEENVER